MQNFELKVFSDLSVDDLVDLPQQLSAYLLGFLKDALAALIPTRVCFLTCFVEQVWNLTWILGVDRRMETRSAWERDPGLRPELSCVSRCVNAPKEYQEG